MMNKDDKLRLFCIRNLNGNTFATLFYMYFITIFCTGVASYGALRHVPPLDFQLCGDVFTVLLFQTYSRRRFTFHTRMYRPIALSLFIA